MAILLEAPAHTSRPTLGLSDGTYLTLTLSALQRSEQRFLDPTATMPCKINFTKCGGGRGAAAATAAARAAASRGSAAAAKPNRILKHLLDSLDV